jgi:ATP-binding cassette, subfamily C (CFTR/MRP), member 1
MMSLAMFMGAVGCFKRIQEFLDTAPRADTRRKPAYLEESLGADSEILSRRSSLSIPSRSSKKVSKISLLDRTNVSSSALSVPRTGQSLEKLTLANYYQFSCSEAIIITNGEFGWDNEKEPLLHGINIKVPRTKLTMIVGPVGSGKSTLLKGMLGELPLTSGTVELSSLRVAFCDQTPWHMNGTIRESIVGASKFDERWYKSVIRGCALDEDLRQVANGDQTKIGSKGISLSGGQSQRIVSSTFPHPRFVVRLHLTLLTLNRPSHEQCTPRETSSSLTMP